MLTRELPIQSLPHLHPGDTVRQSLELMNTYHVDHLPVEDGGKYAGIVSSSDLLEAGDDERLIRDLKEVFPVPSVNEQDHFLRAVQLAVDFDLSVVPVVNEEKTIVGIITYNDLLRTTSEFISVNEPGGLIVLELRNVDYSFNEISRIIETNDAQITQLNTIANPATGLMLVTIKVNKTEVSDIVATFQRYEYNVKHYFGEEQYENELRSNYDNLMNYLRI